MIVVGIDPGWRNFSVHVADVKDGIWTWIYWDNIDMLQGRKTYALYAFRASLRKWYEAVRFLIEQAEHIVIEHQPFLRFQNIVKELREVLPPCVQELDVREMKMFYHISTGGHYTNKKAVVEKFSWVLPQSTSFKADHNLLDSWLVIYYYVTEKLKLTIKSN